MKTFIFILLIALILVSCAAPAEVEPTITTTPPFKITATSNKVVSLGPLYIADAEGYFAKQNIELEIITFDRAPASLPLIATGEIDVYNGVLDTGLFNTILGTDNVAVVADKGHIGRGDCSYYGILLRQDLFESKAIKQPKDLQGQTIDGNRLGTTGYFLDTYLKQDGLSLNDVEIVELPRASVVDAFSNKSIVASVLPDPFLTQVAATGVASIWLRAEDILEGFQAAVVAFGPKLIKDYPDVGVRFMVAYLKGVQQFNQGKSDRNVDIITQYTGLSREDIITACWPPIREDGVIDYASIDAYQKWNVEQGLLDQVVPEEKLWNPYFVDQAYAILNK